MMMALGMFAFELPRLAYQDLQRRTEWKHAGSSRVGARDANQFLGPGADSVTLSGWTSGEIGTPAASLDELRKMGDEGQAWPLVAGTGEVIGAFVIAGLDEGQTLLFADGVPRRREFRLELKRVDEEAGRAAPANDGGEG